MRVVEVGARGVTGMTVPVRVRGFSGLDLGLVVSEVGSEDVMVISRAGRGVTSLALAGEVEARAWLPRYLCKTLVGVTLKTSVSGMGYESAIWLGNWRLACEFPDLVFVGDGVAGCCARARNRGEERLSSTLSNEMSCESL